MHLNCQFSYSKLATYALSSRGWFVKYAIIFLKKLVDIFLNGSTTLMSFNAVSDRMSSSAKVKFLY